MNVAEARMAYTYEQLHAMNVIQLRDIAKEIEHEAVKGFTTMHKEKLIPALCTALGIEGHAHHHALGIDKAKLKSGIKVLKKQREELIAKHDSKSLKGVRKQIKHLKKKIRKATV
jgi:hypothetical protein